MAIASGTRFGLYEIAESQAARARGELISRVEASTIYVSWRWDMNNRYRPLVVATLAALSWQCTPGGGFAIA